MKSWLVLSTILLIHIHGSRADWKANIDDQVSDVIELGLNCIRGILKDTFEPLEIASIPIDLGEMGHVNLNDMKVAGLFNWKLENVQFKYSIINGIHLNITVKFERIKLQTKHELDVAVEDIHVWGAGDLDGDITNLQIDFYTNVKLDLSGIKKIVILPGVENIKVKFTGIFDDDEQSELVNQILNSVLTNWVNEKAQNISDLLEELILSWISGGSGSLFTDNSLDDVIEDIIGSCVEGIFEGVIDNAIEDMKLIDPVDETNLILNFTEIGIGNGMLNIHNLQIEKFSNLNILQLSLAINDRKGVGLGIEADIDITWPEIKLEMDYDGSLRFGIYNINADTAKIMLLLQKFGLKIKAFIQMKPYLRLWITPVFEENRIMAFFSGLKMNDQDVSALLTLLLTNVAPEFIKQHPDDTTDIIGALVVKLIQEIFKY